jgi:cobalamin biosynthesis protein CbiD
MSFGNPNWVLKATRTSGSTAAAAAAASIYF